jgi:hypothetical protein
MQLTNFTGDINKLSIEQVEQTLRAMRKAESDAVALAGRWAAALFFEGHLDGPVFFYRRDMTPYGRFDRLGQVFIDPDTQTFRLVVHIPLLAPKWEKRPHGIVPATGEATLRAYRSKSLLRKAVFDSGPIQIPDSPCHYFGNA